MFGFELLLFPLGPVETDFPQRVDDLIAHHSAGMAVTLET